TARPSASWWTTRRGCSSITRSRRPRTPSACRASSCTRASTFAWRPSRSSEPANRERTPMKRKIALLTALLLVTAVSLAHAQPLSSVKPEQVGLSSEQLGRLVATLRADSEKGQIPGAVLLVARPGTIALFERDGMPSLELLARRRAMTVQDLLRHTSGLTYGVFGASLVKTQYRDSKLLTDLRSNADFVDRLATLPLAYHPGTTWEYSHSTDVVG